MATKRLEGSQNSTMVEVEAVQASSGAKIRVWQIGNVWVESDALTVVRYVLSEA